MSDYHVERMKILEMIEAGELSPKEGLALLEALTGDPEAPGITSATLPGELDALPKTAPEGVAILGELEGDSGEAELPDTQPELGQSQIPNLDANAWRGWWKYVFWTGAAIFLSGTLILLLALQYSAAWFWFLCAAVPLFLGLLILLVGIYSRKSRWLHIRIRQPEGEFPSKIALSFPLPIRPAAWFIRVFGRWIPGLNNTGVDELLLALAENASPETPLYLNVQDDEDGEQVEVYIG